MPVNTTTTQILADLTTASTGGVRVGAGIIQAIKLVVPSANLAKGERRLQSAIFRLRKEKNQMARSDVRQLRGRYDKLRREHGVIQAALKKHGWSVKPAVIAEKYRLAGEAMRIASNAKTLFADVLSSSANAANQEIHDEFGDEDTVAEPEPEYEVTFEEVGGDPQDSAHALGIGSLLLSHATTLGAASQVVLSSMDPLAGPSNIPDPAQTGQDIGMIPLSYTDAGTYDYHDDLDDPFTDNTALTQQAYPDVYAM